MVVWCNSSVCDRIEILVWCGTTRFPRLKGWAPLVATLSPTITESRKDQVIKRFSNPVFDFRCPICGTCAPHQKSQIPYTHITPTYYTLSLCLYYYFKYFLSLILLALFISIRVEEGIRIEEGGRGKGEGKARGPY